MSDVYRCLSLASVLADRFLDPCASCNQRHDTAIRACLRHAESLSNISPVLSGHLSRGLCFYRHSIYGLLCVLKVPAERILKYVTST